MEYKTYDWLNYDNLDWSELSANKSVIDLLKKYPENIDWLSLCNNENAIDILEQNLDNILKKLIGIIYPPMKTHMS